MSSKSTIRKTAQFFTGLLAVALPIAAFAWGHIKYIGTENRPASLLYNLLREPEIRYCLEIDDPANFPERSMRAQVERALAAWIRPLQSARFLGAVHLLQVSCGSNDFHLQIAIGPERKYPELKRLPAYHYPIAQGDRIYSFIRLNTSYTFEIDYRPGKRFGITDFDSLRSAEGRPIADELARYSKTTTAVRTDAFAPMLGLEWQAVQFSTYRVLLHEFGHAFGLCDTYKESISNCDEDHMSAGQPPSVMMSSPFLTLTPDDITGLLDLANRLKFNQ